MPYDQPATVPGLVLLFVVFSPFVFIGILWWMDERRRRRRDEDMRSVAEWERFKRDAAPQWTRSVP